MEENKSLDKVFQGSPEQEILETDHALGRFICMCKFCVYKLNVRVLSVSTQFESRSLSSIMKD